MRKYKFDFYPQLGNEEHFSREFDSLDDAVKAYGMIAEYTIFLADDACIMSDFANYCIFYRLDGDDWIEIDSDYE